MDSSPTLAMAQLSSQLRVAVMRVARRLRAHRFETGCSLTQLATLATVERYGPLSPGDLATHERVQPPSMTRVLSRLEEEGLVARTRHPTDRRQNLISITPAGRDLLAADRTSREVWLAHRLSTLTAEEVDILARALPVLEWLAQA